jgi:hypothetical protein
VAQLVEALCYKPEGRGLDFRWCNWGRVMAQALSHRPLTAEAWIRSWVGPYGIFGGQSGTGTRLSPSTSVFPCQFHSIGAPLHGKMEKTNNLHHRVAQ